MGERGRWRPVIGGGVERPRPGGCQDGATSQFWGFELFQRAPPPSIPRPRRNPGNQQPVAQTCHH